jgi:hypothetical protein
MIRFFRFVFGFASSIGQSADPNDVRTTFLFPEPSVWSGCGRVIDLWGGFDLYNFSSTPIEADLKACYTDWRMVGQDIRDASKAFALSRETDAS